LKLERERAMLDSGILGKPVRDTETCSKCGGAIPDEHVPLMLFADGRNLMWVFCERCEIEIFRFIKPQVAQS
jgi:hypothetical protein